MIKLIIKYLNKPFNNHNIMSTFNCFTNASTLTSTPTYTPIYTSTSTSSINCYCIPPLTKYQEYSLYHTNIINKMIHFITIPIIMTTTAHVLQKIHLVYDDEELVNKTPIFSINYAVNLLSVVQVFYCFYYFSWSYTIGFTMMFYFEAIIQCKTKLQNYLLEKYKDSYNKKCIVDSIIYLIMATAWILQFIGHYIEGNRPALLDNLSTAFLTAPMFTLDFLFKFAN